MFKNSFLLLAMLFATSIVTHAQNADGVTKSLYMYICGGSNNLNPDAGAILGHFGEAGIGFSQNFANAQWLTVTSTLGICTGGAGLVKGIDENGDDAWTTGSGTIDETKGSFTDAYLHVDLGFAGYFNFGLHSQGRLEFDARYPILLPANQKIVLSTAFEVRPMEKLLYGKINKDDDAWDHGQVLGFMKYEFLYSVQFHPEWAYTTDVEFRFNGAGSSTAKNDSMQAIKDSFSIRWNHMISYSNPNGFGGYMNFRYEPTYILKDIAHQIKLSAGFSYSYDLSAL